MRSVSCRVPASSANLGPGFDAFSMALEKPYLRVSAELLGRGSGIEIRVHGRYAARVPSDPSLNSAARALATLLSEHDAGYGVALSIEAEIPVAKGLGSSGAEAVGAVICGARLLGLDMELREVVRIASSAEPGMHADNVAASAYGGFNIIHRSGSELEVLNIEPPEDLGLVVIVPGIEKESTGRAREVIPGTVSGRVYVDGVSRAAMIAASLAMKRLDFVIRHVPFDPYVEPARADAGIYGEGYGWSTLLEEKRLLLERYGVGMTISGAGPSRLLWYDAEKAGLGGRDVIGLAVKEVVEGLRRRGYGVDEVIYTRPSRSGAVLIEAPHSS